MVAVSWYLVVGHSGTAPGGDMIGHAATAEWLRTLPWWDWRGWSDWFYGGQAVGVNYPPLSHAWMRFTHPVHGQMAAVALGLLVLLPWGALRLAREVGCTPRAQRAAVAAVLVLTAASANMHTVLSGFHQQRTFFGSWPAMLAIVAGLHVAAWAARCARPVACGAVVGLAVLLNATVVPGVAILCVALLATSGASFRQAVRWVATTGVAALTMSAWWLVPFLAGWRRLVRWDDPLAATWDFGGTWQAAVLAVVGVGAVWAARREAGPPRRLAAAAAAGLVVTVLADLLGYLRAERWLQLSILVAAMAASGLAASVPSQRWMRPARPAWAVLSGAFLIVFVVVTLRLEVLPLAIWLLWRPQRTWAWGAALAWATALLLVPFWSQIRNPAPPEPPSATGLEIGAAPGRSGAEGLVYTDDLYFTTAGRASRCSWGRSWQDTLASGGRIRPLFGLYKETSPTAEFLEAEFWLYAGVFQGIGEQRPHWFEAWQARGGLPFDGPARAEALGARWYASCGPDGSVSVTELPGVMATGVTVNPYAGERSWHQAAVEWWISIGTREDVPTASGSDSPSTGNVSTFWRTPESTTVPVVAPGISKSRAHPANQAAQGVSLHSDQDLLTIRAEGPGWVWLRVPWDPDWRSAGNTPVHKGGPGHLVVWANQGITELRWSVPGAVDAAAAAITISAALATAALTSVNRRRGWRTDPDRTRPAADALAVFADTVDRWARAAAPQARRGAARMHRRRSRSKQELRS